MVQHVFDSVASLSVLPPVMVVGANEMGVQELFGDDAAYTVQAERLGTGHATLMAREAAQGRSQQVVVTYGDIPLIRAETYRKLAERQAESGAAVVILSVKGEPDSSFGRIVRNTDNDVIEICEVAEAKQRANSEELLNIRELNVGIYCFDADFLWNNLDRLPLRQARSGEEYYLTDMVSLAVEGGFKVDALTTDDPNESLGAGTRAEMVAVERAFRDRAVQKHLANGVTIVDPASTYIDPDVVIGQDTVIMPGCHLQGDSVIGEDCLIGPHTVIRSAEIGDRCELELCVLEDIVLEDDTTLPPFTHALPEE